jgi:predicted RNase H-like nuclease (RuvC/YqgF family)
MQVRYDRAVNEIVAIQDSLSTIVMGEEAASRLASGHEVELRPPGTLHDEVLDRIALLKTALERTKDRIESLDRRLKESGVQVEGLERMVSSLRNSVTEREKRIAALNTQVDTLETRVAGLSDEVVMQQVEIARNEQEIARARAEIATVLVAMGSKKELRTAGVVIEEGGVLGLGKTLKPSGYINPSAYEPIDTDEENVIRIHAEKARVLTAQPPASYELRPVSEEVVELRILNPEAFRKVKHVVIVTG